jgi:hypothetical protein
MNKSAGARRSGQPRHNFLRSYRGNLAIRAGMTHSFT